MTEYDKPGSAPNPKQDREDTSAAGGRQFPPRDGESYRSDDLLTIGGCTLKIESWLGRDPVALHRTLMKHDIHISREKFYVLASKLRTAHFEYYRDYLGLNMLVDFPGYEGLVKAIVPYKLEPVKFYKWWLEKPERVRLSSAEKIRLFLAVDKERPRVLAKQHRDILRAGKLSE